MNWILPAHQITKKDVDQFKEGQWIPECQLVVQWERKDQKPVQLMHKVDLTGAEAPYNFIHLILDPAEKDSMSFLVGFPQTYSVLGWGSVMSSRPALDQKNF